MLPVGSGVFCRLDSHHQQLTTCSPREFYYDDS